MPPRPAYLSGDLDTPRTNIVMGFYLILPYVGTLPYIVYTDSYHLVGNSYHLEGRLEGGRPSPLTYWGTT